MVQPFADRSEQFRGGGEIEYARPAGPLGQPGGNRGPAGVIAGIGGDIAEPAEEAGEGGGIHFGGVAAHRRAGKLAEIVVGQGPAGDADDTGVIRYLPGGVALVQGGQQLAPGEVAGGAEYDEVERIDGYGVRGHSPPSRCAGQRLRRSDGGCGAAP